MLGCWAIEVFGLEVWEEKGFPVIFGLFCLTGGSLGSGLRTVVIWWSWLGPELSHWGAGVRCA